MKVASFALLALDQRGCLVVEWLASLLLEAILLEREDDCEACLLEVC